MENFHNISKFIKENDLDLFSDVSDDLICIICKKIMINATSAPCRCRYCYECIKEYLNGKTDLFCPGSAKYCKSDQLDFQRDIHVDNTINNRISKLIVKCPQRSCEFKNELCQIKDHIEICDKRFVDCPYLQLGCNKEDVQLNNMKPHLFDDSFVHNKLVIEYINNFKNDVEILKNNMKTMEDENVKLKDQIININLNAERKEVTLNEIIERMQNENKTMNRKIYSLLLKNEAMQKCLTKNNEEFTRSINNIEEKQTKVNQTMTILNSGNKAMEDEILFLISEIKVIKSIDNNLKIKCDKIEDDINETVQRLLAQNREEIKRSIDNIKTKINQTRMSLNCANKAMEDKIISEFKMIKSTQNIDNLRMKYYKIEDNMTKLDENASILFKENETIKEKIDLLQSIQDKNDLRMRCQKIEENQTKLNENASIFVKENEIIKEKIDLLQSIQDTNDLTLRCQKIEENHKEIEKKIDKLNEKTEMDSINDDLHTIRYDVMRIEDNVDSIHEKVNYLKTTLKMKGFIWKIENLSKKIETSQNKSSKFIYSDSFETHLNGYRICLYACPNGFSRSKGYFGVFFKLMMGPYDDILPWPCKLNVTIQFIYQDSGAAFLTRERKYENNSDNEFYQKPLDINSRGLGYSHLIRLDELLKQTDLIQNNQLHIKCITNVLD